MERRTFLATSPAFFAALAVSARAAGALPVGFPGEGKVRLTYEEAMRRLFAKKLFQELQRHSLLSHTNK